MDITGLSGSGVKLYKIILVEISEYARWQY